MAITIGVHNSNPTLYYLSRLDHAAEELAAVGETAVFHAYQNGVRTGALLTDGVIDFGGTGSTPPITAQAAGHDIVYTAVSAPRPGHGALLVTEDSPARTVADLKGGTVHLAIGSWQTHLVAKALDDAGLSYATDITAERGGEDSEHLLRSGAIAAWVAQGPQLAAARRAGGLRVLVPTADVITDRSVFFTRRDLAERRPEVTAALLRALRRTDAWVAAHPREAAAIAADHQGGTVGDVAHRGGERRLPRRTAAGGRHLRPRRLHRAAGAGRRRRRPRPRRRGHRPVPPVRNDIPWPPKSSGTSSRARAPTPGSPPGAARWTCATSSGSPARWKASASTARCWPPTCTTCGRWAAPCPPRPAPASSRCSPSTRG
jgi:sulfonate transport system substrate-binding protein